MEYTARYLEMNIMFERSSLELTLFEVYVTAFRGGYSALNKSLIFRHH